MTVRQVLAGFAVVGLLLGSVTAAGAAPAKRRTARSHAGARTGAIDLNSASKTRLTALPGVDASMADKIIAGRPYASSTDLVSKNVLPSETFDKIKGKVTARKAGARRGGKTRRRAGRRAAQQH